MDKKRILIVAVTTIVIILIMIFVMSLFFLARNLEIKEVGKQEREVSENFMFREEFWYYPMKGIVIEMENDSIPIGIAGQKYELNFGRIPLKSSTTKMIDMQSQGLVRVRLLSDGNITPYITMPEKIYLKGDSKEIRIVFNGTKIGNFTGTLMIQNTIPKNILAEKIVEMI